MRSAFVFTLTFLVLVGDGAVAQFGPGVLGVPSVPVGPGVSLPVGPAVGQNGSGGGGGGACAQGQLDFSTNCNTVFYVLGVT